MKPLSHLYCIVLCASLLMSFPIDALAGDCPRCHGRGRIQTQIGVSSYGTSVRYKRCPNCGKRIMVNESHYDPCPACGGSGSRGGSSRSSRESSNNDELLTRMSPEDAVRYQNLAKRLYESTPVPITCTTCKGSGKCTYCGGYHNLDLDATADMRCRVCGGDGFCVTCRGKGNTGVRYEGISESEKQSILAQMKELSDKAYGVSSSNSASSAPVSWDEGSRTSPQSSLFSLVTNSNNGNGVIIIIAGLGIILVVGLLVVGILLFRLIKK